MFLARIIAYAVARSSDSRSRGESGLEFLIIIVLQIVLGLLGNMVVAWFSRQREFRADAGGAHLAGRPRMIAALQRLKANQELIDPSHQALATMKINGTRSWAALFSTHPALEVRIAALENARS
jgi:heat shock protein HtpX